MKKHLLAPGLLLAFVSPACAEQKDNMAQAQPRTEMNAQAKADPSNPFMSAEMDMKDKMMAAKGADAAETWARKMVEHHKGALSMSKIALREADDAMVRQMAQKTIDMQTKDIAELQKWLKDNGRAAQ